LSSTAVPTFFRAAGPDRPHDAEPSPTTRRSPRTIVLLLVAISAAYVGWHLFRGWIPHDDGALAQSADRLLNGELPHRDFDDIYTGGLSFLNAAAFMLFGTSFASLRLPLFAVFLAWVPAVYYIASRFVRQYAAAGITLLAVVWSLPNYTAAMPSWYNLFLATFGLAALFRYQEDARQRWLVAAGIAGGLSILVKVIGFYYVAGILLALVFRAHAVAREEAGDRQPRHSRGYATFVSVSLMAFIAVLARMIGAQLHPPEMVQFIVPSSLVSILIARQEWMEPAGSDGARFRGLARLLVPFLAGLLLPIIVFLVPYILSGSVGALAYGVFVLPMKRFGFAVMNVLRLWTVVGCVPLAILTILVMRVRGRGAVWVQVITAAAAAVILVLTVTTPPVHRMVWHSARNLLPLLGIIAVAVLWRPREADRDDPLLRQRVIALLAVTALCNLVQFPYFVPIYFCYVAPLVALTALALFRYLRPMPRFVPAVVVAFYFLFAVIDVNTAGVFTMGGFYRPYEVTTRLTLPRAGIDVTPAQQDVYSRLIPMLRVRARGGYTWASRDCPEIYFLAGLKNPTRTLFDFFDDTTNYTSRTLRMLDEHHVTAIVMNRWPAFSPQFSDDLVNALIQRYPYATNIGPFHVRWRP
jgi:4-amino-4-deoxy-L-arabinose transferase-like glycosyltransferase